VNFVIIPAGFDPEGLGRVRLGLAKSAAQFIRIVRDHHDLAVGDAHELLAYGDCGFAARFIVDSPGELTIEVLHCTGTRHRTILSCLPGESHQPFPG